MLKRQIPSFSSKDGDKGSSDNASGSSVTLDLQRRLASKEVAAGVAREGKEMAEVEASKLQAALDECRREVRDRGESREVRHRNTGEMKGRRYWEV